MREPVQGAEGGGGAQDRRRAVLRRPVRGRRRRGGLRVRAVRQDGAGGREAAPQRHARARLHRWGHCAQGGRRPSARRRARTRVWQHAHHWGSRAGAQVESPLRREAEGHAPPRLRRTCSGCALLAVPVPVRRWALWQARSRALRAHHGRAVQCGPADQECPGLCCRSDSALPRELERS